VSQIDIFGAKSGSYSRNDKLTAEDFEMLVIAKK
ncbi:MAG: class I SAM-dependent methyltransferase, partial [Candidatus Caldatribacteriota bacterium]